MKKNKYLSDLLKPKCIAVMINADKSFKIKVEKYEELNTSKILTQSEKKEKIHLKDFISKEILDYKKCSKSWILTNGPTGAGKAEYVEESETSKPIVPPSASSTTKETFA